MTADRDPRDVEARLRASLHAYADVVEEEPARRPPVPVASRVVSPVRGWRRSALVAAAVLAVAGGAWLVVDDGTSPAPTAAPGADAAVPGGDARAEPEAGVAAGSAAAGDLAVLPDPAEIGVAYAFDLYTRCGVLGADVGGVWFAARPPLLGGPSTPPPGWDDPYQRGTLTLETADAAVFRDDAGHEVRLRPAESERPPPCDQ